MRRAASLMVAAILVLAGCGSAATPPPTQAPTPNPTPVLTPTLAPTPVPATPVASVAPPSAAPTMTSDDAKIATLIKDGATRIIAYATALQNPDSSVAQEVVLYQKIHQFAASQQTVTAIYTASVCTDQAWTLYTLGINELTSYSESVISWAQAGALGTFPPTTQDSGTYAIGQAITALNSGPCAGS